MELILNLIQNKFSLQIKYLNIKNISSPQEFHLFVIFHITFSIKMNHKTIKIFYVLLLFPLTSFKTNFTVFKHCNNVLS